MKSGQKKLLKKEGFAGLKGSVEKEPENEKSTWYPKASNKEITGFV